MRVSVLVMGLSVYLCSVCQAALIPINFDNLVRGTKVGNQYASKGLTISCDNFTAGHPDQAIIFDSNNHSTKTDTDLQYPWKGGNLMGNNGVRKVLIIAENVTDANHDNLIDDPDDEGGQPAGFVKFKFNVPHSEFGINLIDIDGASEFGADRGYISFRSGGVEKGRAGFGAFVNPASNLYNPTCKWGDHYANHLEPFDVFQKLGILSYDEVWVNIGWSSGIDAIAFDDGTTVLEPEPGFLSMLVIPLALARRPKKRSSQV